MARRKSRYSGIGGQAVLEGVMMKNKEKYAVAVRKPDGEIEVPSLLPARRRQAGGVPAAASPPETRTAEPCTARRTG